MFWVGRPMMKRTKVTREMAFYCVYLMAFYFVDVHANRSSVSIYVKRDVQEDIVDTHHLSNFIPLSQNL